MSVSKVSYNGTTLIDLSDTTAEASDVATGKYFYAADGTKTAGTGGGGSVTLKYGVIRPDAVFVSSVSYDKKIVADEEITIPAYTTTSTTLKASGTISPTITMDLSNYNYYVLVRTLTIPTYNITTKGKGRVEYCFGSALYEVCEFPANTFSSLRTSTDKITTRSTSLYAAGNGSRIIYYSSGTALAAYASAAYAPNQTITAPAVSGTTLTLKTPALIIRGHTTYYTSTYFGATTDIRYQYIIDVYRAPKNNLNLNGWGIFTQAEKIIECVDSSSHTLV